MVKIKPPDLESSVGMRVYGSGSAGIGGLIKKIPEDFIVEEITPDLGVLEIDKKIELGECKEKKEYLHFTLQKNNWDTMRAIKVISNRLHVGRKRFGFAGTKDKRALTTQRVSVWNTEIEKLEKISIRDIVLKDFVYADERITLGMLEGNRFSIVVRDLDLEESVLEDRIKAVMDEVGEKVPNFFGVQRFGTVRPITHKVGKAVLDRDFKRAVMIYLSEVYEGESVESMEARRLLADTGDYQEALNRFPKHLGYERSMLNHLAKTPTDYVGALRELPKKLRWMFIHAYQSYIFNIALSEYIEKGVDIEKLPLAGYGIELDEVTARVLEEKEIQETAFKIKEMPEMSSEGIFRECFIKVKEPGLVSIGDDELGEGNKAVVRFSLSKGSYATSVLREIMKNKYWEQK